MENVPLIGGLQDGFIIGLMQKFGSGEMTLIELRSELRAQDSFFPDSRPVNDPIDWRMAQIVMTHAFMGSYV